MKEHAREELFFCFYLQFVLLENAIVWHYTRVSVVLLTS